MLPDERCSVGRHALILSAACASGTALLGAEYGQTGDWSTVVAWWLLSACLTGAAAWWFRRRARTWPAAPVISPLMLLLLLAPFVTEWVIRSAKWSGHPLEVVLIVGVQSVTCGLAAASVWQRHQPLALVGSLFVTLFAVTLSSHGITLCGAAAYMLCGLSWLTAAHWASLERRMLRREGQRPLWRRVVIPLIALGILVTGFVLAPTQRMWALAGGWVPSSGGDGSEDSAAWRGIGDGEALVAGQENIQSFGPIEDAPFRSGDEPSLYDVFNELYDEPVARNQRQDRAIALPPEFARQVETEMAKSQRATREFSTQRKSGRTGPAAMKNLASEALFYVKGRTPLHLRQELFDLFDGITWYPAREFASDRSPELSMKSIAARPWLSWPGPLAALEVFGSFEQHALKIVHLKTNRIPTPLHLRGVHIDRLVDPKFFRWADDQLLQMERDQLPELTAIHLRSQLTDGRRLREWRQWATAIEPRTRVLPDLPGMKRLRVLAQSWTSGLPRGQAQIEAIVKRLQAEYQLDPEARVPANVACPTIHFLFESRRGPDYQFATAAALLLRSLDYSTRLVGGFYASPARHDARKQHTPVVAADAHTWVEVHVCGQQWITVEATPGYQVLGPAPDLVEHLANAAIAAARWAHAHWLPLAACGGILIVSWYWRQALYAWWAVAWWTFRPAKQPRQRILQTIWLVDLLMRWHGHPRPAGCPPGRWYARCIRSAALPPATTTALATLADWARFAPEHDPLPFVNGTTSHTMTWANICRDVVAAARALNRSTLPMQEAMPETVTKSANRLPGHMPIVTLTVGRISPS